MASARWWIRFVVVAVALGGAAAVFLLGESLGADLPTPGAAGAAPASLVSVSTVVHAAGPADTMSHLLVALAVIVAATQALGWIAERAGQPSVVGEIVAGIALGPSLLGALWPAATTTLFPSSITPFLAAVSELGVILFMFMVGLEFDTAHLRRQARTAIAVSTAGIVLPFVLGVLLALWLYPRFGIGSSGFIVFSLFVGTAMSITAFPVLARILKALSLSATPLGVTALTSAAVGDISAWCLLALVVGLAEGDPGAVLPTIGMTVAYTALMLLVLRPLIHRWLARAGERVTGPGVLSGAVALLLLSAVLTEWIGIHAIFGAFLFGALFPHDSRIADQVRRQVGPLVATLLLPVFFAYSGLRTRVGLLDGVGDWLVCGVIVLVAFLGKFGGVFAAARMTGLGVRDASSLGILMNTRGLVELIVLNVGLDIGILSPALFAMLILMALVTTFATTPILRALANPRQAFVPSVEG